MVVDDPAAMPPIARKLALENLVDLYARVQNTDSIPQRMELQRLLIDLGKLKSPDPVASNAGAGFSVTINIPGERGVTIEGKVETSDE
jgi:hypothetical protein